MERKKEKKEESEKYVENDAENWERGSLKVAMWGDKYLWLMMKNNKQMENSIRKQRKTRYFTNSSISGTTS